MVKHFRVARHTDSIAKIKDFYVKILGLEIIGAFDHHGYQGIFIGEKDTDSHLEFTQSDDKPNHRPDEEDVLVFYLGDTKAYKDCIKRLDDSSYKNVVSKNPYWDQWGKTYLDPDGFRVVVSFKEWSNT